MSKYVIFVAENGDESRISWSDIVEFQIEGSERSVMKTPNGSQTEFNGFRRALIEIAKPADREHLSFGTYPSGTSEYNWLKTCDLSQIILDSEDKRDTYYLSDAQHVESFAFNGNLVLEIK